MGSAISPMIADSARLSRRARQSLCLRAAGPCRQPALRSHLHLDRSPDRFRDAGRMRMKREMVARLVVMLANASIQNATISRLSVMAGLFPAIHVVRQPDRCEIRSRSPRRRLQPRVGRTAWMSGTSPAMTETAHGLAVAHLFLVSIRRGSP